MDLESYYEIDRTAEFILSRNFARVALQFPDDLLKDATKVVRALHTKLASLRASSGEEIRGDGDIGLFVMADTTFGSCCVDEVGASHINADCVIHYGHACLTPTSTLPAFFVFGKAPINVSNCVNNLLHTASTAGKPVMVLFGLEYAYAMLDLKKAMLEALVSYESQAELEIQFSDVVCSVLDPSGKSGDSGGIMELVGVSHANDAAGVKTDTRHSTGGLVWNVPQGRKVEEYSMFWIGSENAAFANLVLTFNGCEIVRYDATEDRLLTDLSQQRRILKRRYFLVEKAKDANIVGILVGTLGVAGYLHMIHQMKELVTGAGKKAYTLAMGRPNPAKLANFPECDVFIYVSCPQTALLDSKEFLAPVITPFEAMIAFKSGSQWTGEYVMEFRDLVTSSPEEVRKPSEEARFSFLKGGYVEDQNLDGIDEEDNEYLALGHATEKALSLLDRHPDSVVKGTAKSGAEFLAARTYHGLDMDSYSSTPEPFIVGRSGKASGYEDEKSCDKD
ncbi:hypothetical protein ACJRO7_000144 [Eucalyptus globulus]|uniref:2-(3-amino-3-carboxypropyl)histidine synthase subunit 2 n=1 Tax=Eucalyptus globulus TaxID=34317 RepID=A0ABD3LSB6_EUCGL